MIGYAVFATVEGNRYVSRKRLGQDVSATTPTAWTNDLAVYKKQAIATTATFGFCIYGAIVNITIDNNGAASTSGALSVIHSIAPGSGYVLTIGSDGFVVAGN